MGILQSSIHSLQNLMQNPLEAVTRVVAVLIALSFHEAAHAFAAHRNGDNTAQAVGRLTLNPLAHLDVMGTLCMIFFRFGWAKPVPINPNNFRNQRKGNLQTSLAGVLTNFLMAFLAIGIYGVLAKTGMFGEFGSIGVEGVWYDLGMMEFTGGARASAVSLMFFYLIQNLIFVNISLGFFNILPIPPLDGYHVFKELTLGKLPANFFWGYERAGSIILLVLIVSGITGMILSPLVSGVLRGFVAFWGLLF